MTDARTPAAGIFISYRQDDAKGWAITLRDDLVEAFGEDQVFLDKDTLHAGNWRQQIHRALDRCKALLVVIGPRWLTVTDEHNRPRIHNDDDVHRQEIALALSRRDVVVIPVLVDDARMPRADQLPADVRTLCDQQARKIGDTEARRRVDMEILIADISAAGVTLPAPANKSDREATRRSPLRWLDLTTLAGAFASTVLAGMYAYLSNNRLEPRELVFLMGVFVILVIAARMLWRRLLQRIG